MDVTPVSRPYSAVLARRLGLATTMVDAATLTPDGVMMLFAAGLSTRQIADDPRCEYGLRRVQQLVAPLRPEPPPVPDAVSMDELVANARAGHGPNYGTPMLLGALRSAYPGWAFPEREVEDSLRRLFPQEFELRRHAQFARCCSGGSRPWS